MDRMFVSPPGPPNPYVEALTPSTAIFGDGIS